MAGDVDGKQSYLGAIASSKIFTNASARSFSSGKFLPFAHGIVSLLTGRARPPPSQVPARFGMLSTTAGGGAPADWAAPPRPGPPRPPPGGGWAWARSAPVASTTSAAVTEVRLM